MLRSIFSDCSAWTNSSLNSASARRASEESRALIRILLIKEYKHTNI